MDFDHDNSDRILDGFGRIGIKIGQGQGIASVHTDAFQSAKTYMIENKLPGYEYAKEFDFSVKNRSSFTGSVEEAAIVTSGLVHYKGGVTTVQDKAVVWGAYRKGVEGFSPNANGYSSQEDFKNNKAIGADKLPEKLQMGGQAYMSEPYFEFFEKAFLLQKEIDQTTK